MADIWKQASIKFCQNWIQLHSAKKNHDEKDFGVKKPYWEGIEKLISWCQRRSRNSLGEKEGMQAAALFMHCMKRVAVWLKTLSGLFPGAAATFDNGVYIVKYIIWKKRCTPVRKSWLL